MRWVMFIALLLASHGLLGCSGVCQGGCVCSSSESECAAAHCAKVYSRQPNGSLKYAGCTNGPADANYVIDAGLLDANSQ